jgi:multisubunit Na+/H+ antiporter MnhF subunit
LNDDPNGSSGYDGQFFYYIAKYLFNTPQYMIDAPSYRFQRILYPLFIRIFSLGQVGLMPWVMIFINIISIVIGTEVLDYLLRLKELNPWYSLIYGLFIGHLWCVRRDLTEPLMYMFILLAIYAYERKSSKLSVTFFILSIFAKESAILFVAGYIVSFLLHRKFRNALSFGIVTLTPFFFYQLFLWNLFGNFGFIRSVGLQMNYIFKIIPFYGLFEHLQRQSILLPELFNILFLVIIPSIFACILTIEKLLKREFKPEVFYLLVNALFLIFLQRDSYNGIVGYSRIVTKIVTSFLLYGAMTRNQSLLNFSLIWILPLVSYFTHGG